MRNIKKILFFLLVFFISLACSNLNNELFKAIEVGDQKKVMNLIRQGADVNAKESDGWTPLHEATVNIRRSDIARMLIEKGADVNAKTNVGWTPLHGSVLNEDIEIAQLLIEKGADVNLKDKEGKSPLDLAKSDEMKKILRKAGQKQ